MGKRRDYSGERCGKLVAVRFLRLNASYKAVWEFKCDCGNIAARVGSDVFKRNGTEHCGCRAPKSRIHGLSTTPEYSAWKCMRQRCNNPDHQGYAYYGGRGIKFNSAWDGPHGFAQFLSDVGPRPTPQHSIDREDNDGNYEPGNVRWVTMDVQSYNKRLYKSNTTGISGVNPVGASFTSRLGTKYLGCTSDFFEACCLRKSAEAAEGMVYNG